MFSATWPNEVQMLAREYCLFDPVTVRVGNEETVSAGGLTINKDILQDIVVLDSPKLKFERLTSVLQTITWRQS